MLSFPQDPMLARHVPQMPEPTALDGGCVYEPKFDGYRAMLFVGDDGCRVQSRRGHDITEEFRDVADAAAQHLPAGVVLDGELVVWTGGALDFGEVQRRLARGGASHPRLRPASFVAFDLLEAAGTDVRSSPLTVRRQLLETVLDGAPSTVQLCPQTADVTVARAWMEDFAAADLGMEGLVAKGRGTAYRNGARAWLKYRVRDTVEVVVGGVSGSVEAPGRLVFGLPDDDGTLHFAGTSTELTPRQRAEVGALLRPSERPHPWLAESRSAARWGGTSKQQVHPVLETVVVEVSVDSSVQDGRWRHPAKLVRVRPDLTPADVTVRR